MNASTLSSMNNLMIFPVVTLLLHAESSDTKLQHHRMHLSTALRTFTHNQSIMALNKAIKKQYEYSEREGA